MSGRENHLTSRAPVEQYESSECTVGEDTQPHMPCEGQNLTPECRSVEFGRLTLTAALTTYDCSFSIETMWALRAVTSSFIFVLLEPCDVKYRTVTEIRDALRGETGRPLVKRLLQNTRSCAVQVRPASDAMIFRIDRPRLARKIAKYIICTVVYRLANKYRETD